MSNWPIYNKHLRYAIPFVIFIIGGSLGLQEFTSLRYKYRSTNLYNPRDEIKKAGLDMTDLNQITLESQYEHVKKKLSNLHFQMQMTMTLKMA
ncbi:cytochrome c oxidase assembly protein COX16 homolog, mitochondrial isoform X5 [Nasonia vitripennis]|nr:cytochrome c oxidase assembly protein COX16 homolog, mitochondrial isoform X5 [Nasonia vitripennis]